MLRLAGCLMLRLAAGKQATYGNPLVLKGWEHKTRCLHLQQQAAM